MSGFASHLNRSATSRAAFDSIRVSVQDSIYSNVEVPSTVVETRWNSELRCATTFRDLRTPIEVMTADAGRKLTKYRLNLGQWQLVDELFEVLQVRLLFSGE